MIKAFYYMFKEFDFKKDLLPLWTIIFIAEFVINFAGLFSPLAMYGRVTLIFQILLLIGFITTFIPCGYGMDCLKNYLTSNNEHKLPEIDIKKNFIKGFKFMFSFGLLYLAMFIIFAVLSGINSLLTKIHLSPLTFAVVTIACLMLIIASFLFIASTCTFAKKEDIFSFLRLPSLYNIINANVAKYFIGFVIFIVLMAFFYFIRIALIITLIQKGFILMTLYAFIMSIISTYFALIFLYLFKESVNPDLI